LRWDSGEDEDEGCGCENREEWDCEAELGEREDVAKGRGKIALLSRDIFGLKSGCLDHQIVDVELQLRF
jgi:hypothetical protein